MQLFRHYIIRSVFLVVTGLTFLNLSFVLAEISALRHAYDEAAMQNIATMFRASMNEEETESEHAPSVKQADIVQGHMFHLRFEEDGVTRTLKSLNSKASPHGGYSTIDSPPPDRNFIG